MKSPIEYTETVAKDRPAIAATTIGQCVRHSASAELSLRVINADASSHSFA
jgi:hypothetical protein